MKQLLQNLRTGEMQVVDLPCPRVGHGQILIQTRTSLISPGTERMLVEFSEANLLQKARQQPDRVKQVLDKMKTHGLLPTLEAVFRRLDEPLPLGYCNAGVVLEVGSDVRNFQPGDRVASNGPHAEVVRVPQNLCTGMPSNVSDESAAFVVVGAIALQGIRLAKPTLGEVVVVSGLGLVGQIAVQLLRAQGCHVLGIDVDSSRVELARQFGADGIDLSKGEDPLAAAEIISRGRGVDAVIITASTKSNEPVTEAAKMCRKRGRIVLVGVTGLELSRADFYEKELSFQVSCSYGPGRYDPEYEEKGNDYPIGFVRWTEQRNMEAVLDLLVSGALDVAPLITHQCPFEDALKAYDLLMSEEPSLGILLEYSRSDTPLDSELETPRVFLRGPIAPVGDEPVVGFIGSGNYASQILIPAFKKSGAYLKTVASSSGRSGVHAGRKNGFEEAVTDTSLILADEVINTVVIATRHDSHARFVLGALRSGKHVFVEKPLCLSLDELAQISSAYEEASKTDGSPILMVGFNRRFSPHIRKIEQLLDGFTGPKSFMMTVNAGEIPSDHWTQDWEVGGGRIIGEACHFIDLLRHLAASPITRHQATYMRAVPRRLDMRDIVTITLSFVDGSMGTIHYFANGNKSFPKERLEVFSGGRILQLDNFRRLRGFGWPGFSKMNLRRQDKGQKACVAAFLDAISEGRQAPIPISEIEEVCRVTMEIANNK